MLTLFREDLGKDILPLTKEEIQHIRALRLRKGDSLWVSDGKGIAYRAVVISPGEVKIDFSRKYEDSREQNVAVFSALPSGNRADRMLDMATQLGISRFYPVIFEFSERKHYNQERAARIIKQAASQSGRWKLPELHGVIPFRDIATRSRDFRFLFYADRNPSRKVEIEELTDILRNHSLETVAVLVGPEGGFSPVERKFLEEHYRGISLANNILRIETAVVSLLSFLGALRELIRNGI